MPLIREITEHRRPTAHRGLRYLFTPKHHGCEPGQACWLEALSEDDEFGVFELADGAVIEDEKNNLYGVLPAADGSLHYIGTFYEQVAEFPHQRAGNPWHGYPCHPLSDDAPQNRLGERGRPPKVVFDRLMTANLITRQQHRRLMKGETV